MPPSRSVSLEGGGGTLRNAGIQPESTHGFKILKTNNLRNVVYERLGLVVLSVEQESSAGRTPSVRILTQNKPPPPRLCSIVLEQCTFLYSHTRTVQSLQLYTLKANAFSAITDSSYVVLNVLSIILFFFQLVCSPKFVKIGYFKLGFTRQSLKIKFYALASLRVRCRLL